MGRPAVAAVWCGLAFAHDVRPAYLELRETAPGTFDVLWRIPTLRPGARPPVDLHWPEGAVETTPRRSTSDGASWSERFEVRDPGGAHGGGALRLTGMEGALTDVLVRVERLSGAAQTARLTTADPVFRFDASPEALRVARTYFGLGVEHILTGADHLLFVLALILLTRGAWRLVKTVTAFTLAHSLTLALATLGLVRVPTAPVEASIALSIVLVAAEIVRAREGAPGLTERAPWIVAFTFGLLHGFGFAGALSQVGLPPGAIPAALFFFNCGVEAGQLLFVGAVIVVMALLRRVGASERLLARHEGWAWRVPAYAIGSMAAYWVLQRLAAL